MYSARCRKPVPSNSFAAILDDFITKGFNEFTAPQVSFSRPNVNIIESDEAFHIELAAPGLTKEDFKVNIDKDQLTIKVAQETKTETNEEPKFKRREFNFSSFTRSFHLPHTIDKEAINAKYKDGILTLTLNKKEEAKDKAPRHIEIN